MRIGRLKLQLTSLVRVLFAAACAQTTQHLVGLRVDAVHPPSVDLGACIQGGAGHLKSSQHHHNDDKSHGESRAHSNIQITITYSGSVRMTRFTGKTKL